MKTLKAVGQSVSGKTYYYRINIPAGVLSVYSGVMSGTCKKSTARIDEILWCYSFGKKMEHTYSICKGENAKHKLSDYISVMERYAKDSDAGASRLILSDNRYAKCPEWINKRSFGAVRANMERVFMDAVMSTPIGLYTSSEIWNQLY